MVLKSIFSCLLLLSSFSLLAQQKFVQPNFSAAGNNSSTNSTQRLYSVIGQPIAVSNTTRSQTQAGFMQVVDYVIIDAIAPVINYTTATQKINKQAPPTLTATITDNIGISSAKIFYRRISDAAWKSADLSKSGNSYSIAIQTSWFDAMGMEYYFEARDATPNVKREPVSGSFYAYVTSAEETIPSERVGFGTETVDYKIIAFPYTTSNNSVTSLLNELGDFSNTKWRMASYNNSGDSFQEYPSFTTLSRGVGYWILVKTPVDIKIGPLETSVENRASLYQMTLKPGWNMIGNPYPVNIDWSDVRTLNNNPNVGEIKVYNNGFSNGDVIAPYEGGFVFVNGSSDISIKVPFAGQTAEGGRKKSEFSHDISSDTWLVNLALSQKNCTYLLGGIGMHRKASMQVDQYDDYNPPQFINSPEINFPHPEHKLGSFCRDVIPTQQEASWSFAVQGEIGEEITLSWDTDLGTGPEELFIVDDVNLTVIDLKKTNQYSFTLAKSYTFKVYFGENIKEQIKPMSISLLAPYPNPASAGAQTKFKLALPDDSQSYSVVIDLISSSGIPVDQTSRNLSSGIHEINTRLSIDNRARGIYYYKVYVHSDKIQKTFTGKLIIL